MARLWASLVVAVGLLAVGGTAQAREKAECAAAYEEAQVLRQERKLQEAQSRLIICADPACPGAVVRDCLDWLGDVEKSMPSIVVAAQDEDGIDLLNVRITLDGTPMEGDWTGKALPLNPGAHTVRVELDGYHPAEQSVVAREGEKSRVVSVVLRSLVPKAKPPVASTGGGGVSLEVDSEPEEPKRLDWRVYTLGALAVVSGAGGVVLGMSGRSDVDTLKTKCSPECQESEVNLARTKLITANVAFGVAGVATIGAVVMWVMNGRRIEQQERDESSAGATTAGFAPLSGGGMAVLSKTY
jgi:hypothetical protein